MSKISVQSPANIAFIKYWGFRPGKLNIPYNDNISMTLSNCQTITTVQTDPANKEDIIEIETNGQYKLLEKNSIKNKKAYEQIERIRALTSNQKYVHIKTRNTFPADTGVASSASGFSALTAGLVLAYGLNEFFDDKQKLSRLVRMSGSGSAVRSIYGGYVEFTTGDDTTSIARQIADENHWDLVDIIALVTSEKKAISTSDGHNLVNTSPYFETRLNEMQDRITGTRKSILEKNLAELGPYIETDTLSMHAVMMTSVPPVFYWEPGTVAVMREVMKMRTEGITAYYSIDAGANVHVICEKKNAGEVKSRLQAISMVTSTIYNEPCAGVHQITDHLF